MYARGGGFTPRYIPHTLHSAHATDERTGISVVSGIPSVHTCLTVLYCIVKAGRGSLAVLGARSQADMAEAFMTPPPRLSERLFTRADDTVDDGTGLDHDPASTRLPVHR